MDGVRETTDLVAESANEFWQAVGGFVPGLIGAILLIILGALVAKLAEMVVIRVLELLGVNKFRNKKQVSKTLKDTGLDIDIVKLAGRIVFWVVIFVFAMTAVDVLGLDVMSEVLRALIGYLPSVLAAVVILTVTIAGARLAKAGITAALKQLSVDYAGLIGAVAQWALIVFGVVLTLDQLGLDTTILTNNITIIVAGIMLAFGLAFGLGGQKHAAQLLDSAAKHAKKSKKK